MLKIAVCDDEKDIAADLKRDLNVICERLEAACEIDLLFSAEELCRNLDSGTHYDIIYLDIEFDRNEINGVEAGRLIREVHHNNTASIVYITWEQKYLDTDMVNTRPLRFLTKPLTFEKIEQTVKTHLKITNYGAGTFAYQKGHDILKVRVKDISYLENHERKVIIHCGQTRDNYYGTLKQAYQQLKEFDFLFIHASYLVNFDAISVMKYNRLLTTDGVSLPVSTNRRIEVKDRYMAIMERRRLV